MTTHIEFARRTFGLNAVAAAQPEPCKLPPPQPGKCLAVIGPSGAGKTLALNALGGTRVEPLRCEQLDTPVLELFDERLPSAHVMRTLARVGLADGRLWGLCAKHLSAGECRRLEFALALCGHDGLLVADEFDAHLDADTACVLAQNLRRLVERDRLRLAVSTHNPQTLAFLQPARVVEIDRGVAHERADLPGPAHAVMDDVEIIPGRLIDYKSFAHWHYLGPGRPGPTSDVFIARHRGRAVGVAVFGYPHLLLSVRGEVLPRFAPKRIAERGASELNRRLRLLSRVVVEPRFRGVGIARALVQHGLERVGADWVECIAQMGAFSDFLTGAGFRRLGRIAPPVTCRRVSAFLRRHGIPLTEMLDPCTRAMHRSMLRESDQERFDVLLAKLVGRRIETGFGSLRGKPEAEHEAVLRKALARIEAQPDYYLWTRRTR